MSADYNNNLAHYKQIVNTNSTQEDESYSITAEKETTAEDDGDVRYSIINLDTGKSYVQASRKVIHGKSVAKCRSQISGFFNKALKNGPIEVETTEGDTLTISKETANKARSKATTENGIVRELTDKEFLVKLNAEAHIDELAEISKKKKGRIVPDSKSHSFAKDGFTYRTVYFQDFDGTYYRITLSVGENNGISTVYNVGKIKAEDIPDGNIISTIGSKADMSSADTRLPQNEPVVNTNSTQEDESYSITAEKETTAEDSGDVRYSIASTGAKTANISKLNSAIVRTIRGDDRETVRRETGWYKAPDGKWRFYIPDDALDVDGLMLLDDTPGVIKKLGDCVKHDKLFSAYPQLKRINIRFADWDKKQRGGYSFLKNEIVINKKYKSDSETLKDILIHEIQHAIQHIEGLALGGNEKIAYRYAINLAFEKVKDSEKFKSIKTKDDRLDYLTRVAQELFGAESKKDMKFNAYEKIYGEVEARQAKLMRVFDEDLLRLAAPDTSGIIVDSTVETEKLIENLKSMGYNEQEIINVLRRDVSDQSGSTENFIQRGNGAASIDERGSLLRGGINAVRRSVDGNVQISGPSERESGVLGGRVRSEVSDRGLAGGLGDTVSSENDNSDIRYSLSDTTDILTAAQEIIDRYDSGDVRYSLAFNAKSELHKANYDKNYRNEVLLRDDTPPIMLAHKGVKNRPMVMNALHIRENVFTEEEARNLGLKVDEHTHYHGIGEVFFLK